MLYIDYCGVFFGALVITGILTRVIRLLFRPAAALFRKKYNRSASAYCACVTSAIVILGLGRGDPPSIKSLLFVCLLLWLALDLHNAKKIDRRING